MAGRSPFINPGPRTTPDTLALIHLSRDNLQPVYLQENTGAVDGYAEGNVINTRFGSFPHSTLINVPWGSQVRASVVDTGSRGRKRKPDNDNDDTGRDDTPQNDEKSAEGNADCGPGGLKVASSGFIHVLPPTPELWTTSLPHRTQVVYTPDYSYILHRIRTRPGMRIIEAGAGSGSFTHAAVRAVYNGYPTPEQSKRGKVFSFEYDKARFEKMQEEIAAHKLDELVHISHRDVYSDGFLINDGQSPEVDCIFLDLPAPWKALHHLSRSRPSEPSANAGEKWVSPLRADRSVYLCTFSPCTEQVTKTVEAMRKLGWMEIEMVEVAHRRINVMRERVGLNMPVERGTNQTAGNVDEALARLKEVESKSREFHNRTSNANDDDMDLDEVAKESEVEAVHETNGQEDDSDVKSWMLGHLIHRTEAEIKTHTSYLVFAVLPREWSENQEAAALEQWPCGQESGVIGSLDKATRKQEKREYLQGKKRKKENSKKAGSNASPAAKKSKGS